jgi:hypothetical protein
MNTASGGPPERGNEREGGHEENAEPDYFFHLK